MEKTVNIMNKEGGKAIFLYSDDTTSKFFPNAYNGLLKVPIAFVIYILEAAWNFFIEGIKASLFLSMVATAIAVYYFWQNKKKRQDQANQEVVELQNGTNQIIGWLRLHENENQEEAWTQSTEQLLGDGIEAEERLVALENGQ